MADTFTLVPDPLERVATAQAWYLAAKRQRIGAIRDAVAAGAGIRPVARATGLDPSHVLRIARKARENA